jgi:hypothetical protein
MVAVVHVFVAEDDLALAVLEHDAVAIAAAVGGDPFRLRLRLRRDKLPAASGFVLCTLP